MEDQGKRLLLAVAVAFALFMAYSLIFPPEKREESKPAPRDGGAEQKTAAEAPAPAPTPETGTPAPGAPAPSPDAVVKVERPPEQRLEFRFDKFVAEISTHGGSLTSWQLQGEQFRNRRTGGKAQIDLVQTGDVEGWRPFTLSMPNSTHAIPAETAWTVERKTDTELDLAWSSDALRVVKRYEFFPDDYLVQLTIDVSVLASGEAKQALAISQFQYQDPTTTESASMFKPAVSSWSSACMVDGEVRSDGIKTLQKQERGRTGRVRWNGFLSSYFFAAQAPKLDADPRLTCEARAVEGRDGAMEGRLIYPFITLKAGDPVHSRTLTAYFGPKFLDKLESVPEVIDYDPGFAEAVDLGWFAFIARPLLWLLKAFHGLIGNWGIAIIMLTFVVKLATLYWTTKSMRSMKAMAKLRPEIEKLQKKYKDDKQRQQVEMMNLYKAHKVNPLAGCLPMLLQMPIWFALYKALNVAAELHQATFIPGWLTDLTAPDRLYIMPVLMTGMMFLQTRLTPTTVDSTQQKIMMYGMPLLFGGFSLFFPSGLTVYILTNTVLTAGHQLWMNRTDSAREAARAARPAAAAAVVDATATEDDEDDERSRKADPGKRPGGPGKRSGGKRKRARS